MDHVSNNHKPLLEDQVDELMKTWDEFNSLSTQIVESIHNPSEANEEDILNSQQKVLDILKQNNKLQLRRLKNSESGTKNSITYLKFIDEWRHMVLHIGNLYKSYRDFVDYQKN